MIGYLILQALRISSSLILTRLLMPDMFGVMAIATTVQVSVAMISDLGLRPAAIQSPRGDEEGFLNTAWTLQFLHGLLIWFSCVGIAIGIACAAKAGSLPLGSVYAQPNLPLIIMTTSFSSVILGLQSMKNVRAVRHLNLARVTTIEIASQVVSLTAAITLAYLTGSIWSFVISTLLSSLVVTVLGHFWLEGNSDRFGWDGSTVWELIRFGRWIMLSSLLSVTASASDRMFLGGLESPMVLGLYSLALNLIGILDGAGGKLFSTVAMPALSKIVREQPDRLRSAFLKIRLPFDLIFVASAGAIYAGGEMLSDLLYDDRYRGAGPIIQILSFGLVATRFNILSLSYLAFNEPRNQTILNLVRALSILLLLPTGHILFGFEGALWAIALHGFATIPFIAYFNHHRGLNDVSYEVAVLLAWPVGFVCGSALTSLATMLPAIH